MPLPSFAQAWLQARESADAAICIIELYHPMMETFRFARNTEDVVSRGNTYSAAPFDLDILNDNDQPPRATLTFPNVDRSIGIKLSEIVGPPQITIEVISSAEPDEPIMRAARLRLQNVNVDPLVLSGDLLRIDDGTETCGTIRVVPSKFPALFRRR
jgi:hypothetical protein